MANEKKIYSLTVSVKGEIRKVEEEKSVFKNKNGEDIESTKWILYIDDEEEKRFYLTERDAERVKTYKKGMVGIFKLKINCEEEYGTKCKIQILDFVEVEED